MIKRSIDVLFAAAGLIVLCPVLVVVAVVVKLDSPGPIFFKQERIGRGFRPFFIYKFRTMRQRSGATGPLVTVEGDWRITRVGRILRRTKIDELPQLINVLKGDMSVVGPRPEVREYVDLFKNDYEIILKIRPGLTDPASLKYRNEESLLARSKDPHTTYVREVLPDKIRLAQEYTGSMSFCKDIGLICQTVLKVAEFSVWRGVRFRSRHHS